MRPNSSLDEMILVISKSNLMIKGLLREFKNMPKIEDVSQAKAVALYEFRKLYPYGVRVKMNAQRMSDVWIVRVTWDSPLKESEYRIDANTGQAWKIK